MDVAIVGWGHTCFGLPEQDTLENLSVRAEGAEPDAVFNMGGSGAASYCSLPETQEVT
jgi:hypothetical protein